VKRLNRKEIIEQFEEMRQGFADAKMKALEHEDKVDLMTFTTYHKYADKIVVELGGESVLDKRI